LPGNLVAVDLALELHLDRLSLFAEQGAHLPMGIVDCGNLDLVAVYLVTSQGIVILRRGLVISILQKCGSHGFPTIGPEHLGLPDTIQTHCFLRR
jgi:hypothetical protein